MSPAASVIAVEDAASRLRAGQPVIVQDESAAVLVQAAETATADSLARLIRLGEGRASLTLTAPRGAALDLPINGHPVLSLSPDRRHRSGDGAPADRSDPRRPPVRPEGPGRAARCLHIRGDRADQARPAPAGRPDPAARTGRGPAAGCAHRGARRRGLVQVDAAAITGYADLAALTLRPVAEARLPIAVAENARIVGFRPADGSVEQLAIVVGVPAEHQPVLCRIHSACFTGDLLGSLRCDCGSQLQEALRLMGEAGHGVLLYLPTRAAASA